MFECVFTNQKNKKTKKWKDGFVALKSGSVKIYDENNKFVYSSTKYVVEDDLMDLPIYLVQTSHMRAFLGEENVANAPKEESPAFKIKDENDVNARIKEKEALRVSEEEKIDTTPAIGLKARSNEDTIGLFKK